jgi:hypothetical protein
MRYSLPIVAAVYVAACSSGDDEPACRIEGTYSATGVTESGDCPPVDGNQPVTDTISRNPDGSYLLEVQGITGGCRLEQVETCKLQGKCDVDIADATTQITTGTAQYSWTFRRDGFDGFSTVSIPPARSLPNGCTGSARVTGARR